MRSEFSIVELYKDVLGSTPGVLVKKGRQLTPGQMDALMDAYMQTTSGAAKIPRAPGEVWPLVSHHSYGNRGLFGVDKLSLLPRTLTMLLIHDGLVVADPVQDVLRSWTGGHRNASLRQLQRTTEELAQVEPLLNHGVLHLTQIRPALQDTNRNAVLKALGLTPDMRVFTNFAEASVALPDLPISFQQRYVAEAHELFGRFGLRIPQGENSKAASKRVSDLAAAVIEVTWQFAVAADDPGCDIAVRGTLEQHLAEAIINTGLESDLVPGRHFSRLVLGKIPNLDATSLSVSDALAIRRGDEFEKFRSSVRIGLNQLDAEQRSGTLEHIAVGSFQDAMRESTLRLQEQVSRQSFKDMLIPGGVSAAVGAASGLVAGILDPVLGTAAAASGSLTGVILTWLYGQRHTPENRVAKRYLTMLGGDLNSQSGRT